MHIIGACCPSHAALTCKHYYVHGLLQSTRKHKKSPTLCFFNAHRGRKIGNGQRNPSPFLLLQGILLYFPPCPHPPTERDQSRGEGIPFSLSLSFLLGDERGALTSSGDSSSPPRMGYPTYSPVYQRVSSFYALLLVHECWVNEETRPANVYGMYSEDVLPPRPVSHFLADMGA